MPEMHEDDLVGRLAQAMADSEYAYFSQIPFYEGITTYASLPDDPSEITYPFTCHNFNRVEFDPNTDTTADTMGGEASVDWQTYWYDVYFMVSARKDDMKALVELAGACVLPFRRCYMGNTALSGACSTAIPVKAMLDKAILGGVEHYGVWYTVKVQLDVDIVVSMGIDPLP